MSFRSSKMNGVLPFPHGKLAPVVPLAPKPLRPVLIILHQEASSPGRVGNALRALGHGLDIRRPRFGDPLP
jgi:GMP synthase (glutamine-hydrolysing)